MTNFSKRAPIGNGGSRQGLVDVLNVALDKTATSAAMYCVFRHARDGRVDDEMRRRMRLIVPHLRRAVLIGNVIDFKTAEADSFADTVDASAPACSSSMRTGGSSTPMRAAMPCWPRARFCLL
jgi:hypothetical protein